MKKLKQLGLIGLCWISTFVGYGQMPNHPTMVLVHGALFTSNVWLLVQTYLQERGYPTLTLNTPGRFNDGVTPENTTLSAAVNKLCDLVTSQSDPVILVGHNQAGAMITQATARCGSRIAALVYLAAVIPWPGEKPFDLLSDQDNHNFDEVAPLDSQTGLSTPDLQAPIKALFMADVDDAQAQLAITAMVPEPICFAYDTLDYDFARFESIPKYYIKTTQDRIIEPHSQDTFIQRQNLNRVFLLNSSHSPFISKPIQLGQFLATIADLHSTIQSMKIETPQAIDDPNKL